MTKKTNEQVYKTPDERNNAFSEWCFNRECGSCELKSYNLFDGGAGCRFYWLALEAEKENPGPCPYCGGKTHINLGHLYAGVVHYWVDCINPECMYRSAHYTDKDEAISAHNRMARAVRAQMPYEEAKEGGAK